MSSTNQTQTPATSSAAPIALWQCSDRLCNTGQTYNDREKEGRKVVSHFFGRNKTATKAIHNDVWHWQCRKGYQRAKYAADNGSVTDRKNFWLSPLRDQLIRIKIWRPAADFTIQLSKPAKTRLNNYHSILRRNGQNTQDAVRQVTIPPKLSKSGKPLTLDLADSILPDHAEHIDTHFAGSHHSSDYILDTIFPWIEQEFASGAMTTMPPIEFLINDLQPGELTTDPATNYSRWTAQVDGHSYASPLPSGPRPKRKAKEVDSVPAKRPRLILKAPSSPPISPKTRPPIRLSLKNPGFTKPTTSAFEPFRDPFAAERARDEAAARELLALGEREREGVEGRARPPSRAGQLPLYVPPPPLPPRSVATGRARGGRPKRARSARVVVVEVRRDGEESEEEEGEESEGSDGELAGPIMSRGMVFAGAKRKRR